MRSFLLILFFGAIALLLVTFITSQGVSRGSDVGGRTSLLKNEAYENFRANKQLCTGTREQIESGACKGVLKLSRVYQDYLMVKSFSSADGDGKIVFTVPFHSEREMICTSLGDYINGFSGYFSLNAEPSIGPDDSRWSQSRIDSVISQLEVEFGRNPDIPLCIKIAPTKFETAQGQPVFEIIWLVDGIPDTDDQNPNDDYAVWYPTDEPLVLVYD